MPLPDDPRLFGPQCPDLTPVVTVHENPWFTVKNRGGFYTTEPRAPQVVVLPVIENRAILLVKVKRPVISDVPWELPAGGMESIDDSSVCAAVRELAEETGVLISDLSRFSSLPAIAGSPNRDPCLIHIYQIELRLDEFDNRELHDEEIECVEIFSFETIREMLIHGDIYIALPVGVLSRFLLSS